MSGNSPVNLLRRLMRSPAKPANVPSQPDVPEDGWGDEEILEKSWTGLAQGYMEYKQKGIVKGGFGAGVQRTWMRCWFVLGEKSINVFQEKDSKKCERCIWLRTFVKLESLPRKHDKEVFRIVLRHEPPLVFRTDTAEDKEQWMQLLGGQMGGHLNPHLDVDGEQHYARDDGVKGVLFTVRNLDSGNVTVLDSGLCGVDHNLDRTRDLESIKSTVRDLDTGSTTLLDDADRGRNMDMRRQ